MSGVPHQDVAPRGGFPQINFKRNLPKKGFSSLAIFAGVVGISVFGFQQYIYHIRIENEKRIARANERSEFLEKLDKAMHQKLLSRVEKQAELDVLAMEKLIKGEHSH